ncbi:TerD family protein [Nocardia acidivorans]|uniref:TerD family protein n=1 Tax=Nocardia acidivorans TaxID=404580 RepID=UPI001FE01E2B|nr:TerD family protein [Nocardia acidivorans]
MELTRGANAPVGAAAVSLVLEWGAGREVDPQALLLAASGKIRGNDDFVFFNAPRHPSGAVVLEDAGAGRATLRLALTAIEPGVDKVVIAGSVEQGSFRDVDDLTLTVRDTGGVLLRYPLHQSDAVTAMVLGEFYRRNGDWKFRAVGQGWTSGLRGLAEEFGVQVDDEPTQPPLESTPPPTAPSPTPPPLSPTPPPLSAAVPAPRLPVPAAPAAPAASDIPAGWYSVPGDSARLRWWTGAVWTEDYRPSFPANDPATCPRCGRPRHVPRFGGPAACRWCETEVNGLLEAWRGQMWQVLTSGGPHGPAWEQVWGQLRFHMISEATGREALRPLAVAHLERVVAFAFADGEIEESELVDFDRTVATLRAATDLAQAAQHIEGLRQRMLRGRALTQVKVGDLPLIERPGLHLEADELLYLDVNATQIRYLANGPKQTPGRLIASSKKLRFVGDTAGTELLWTKMVAIRHEYDTVVIQATSARGGGSYRVPDAEYVAAILEGALRVAKRLVLAPGQRDSRAVPQDVKARVWQRDGGKCQECGDKQYLEFDHIIPWSQGGATSVDNLQILCRKCNQRKGARI